MNKYSSIQNINELDSPALIVFSEKVKANIKKAVEMVADPSLLWPHIKTHKTAEVIKICQQSGIKSFKCATIAEAELLGICEVENTLLAYQLFGPKAERFVSLIKKYPKTKFSCLVDNIESAEILSKLGFIHNINFQVFIDINIGQNRTGILPENAINLVKLLKEMPNLELIGIHAYDGHIHEASMEGRKSNADLAYSTTKFLQNEAEKLLKKYLKLIMSGSPPFPIHAKRKDLICSPGTFVFWDAGYSSYQEQNFEPAILVVTRVVSKPKENLICVDLGYKSIASERPLSERIVFLNAEFQAISHSEEHLVLEIKDGKKYKIGDVLYGIPMHICPTVALYEKLNVVENDLLSGEIWKVVARDRKVNC